MRKNNLVHHVEQARDDVLVGVGAVDLEHLVLKPLELGPLVRPSLRPRMNPILKSLMQIRI